MDFIILAVVLFIGILLGWRLRERHAIRVVNQIIKEAEEATEEQTEERVKMRLERHGEVIYAFTVEDDSFIAQGDSLETLDAAIVARFPGKKFSIREDNIKELGIEV